MSLLLTEQNIRQGPKYAFEYARKTLVYSSEAVARRCSVKKVFLTIP